MCNGAGRSKALARVFSLQAMVNNMVLSRVRDATLYADVLQGVVDPSWLENAIGALREIALRVRIMNGNISVRDEDTGKVEILSLPVEHKTARRVLGKNFCGVEEAVVFLGAAPGRKQFEKLRLIPFEHTVISANKEAAVLVADMGFPLAKLFSLNQSMFSEESKSVIDSLGDYAMEDAQPCWRLIYRDIALKGNQQSKQPVTLRTAVNAMILYQLAYGENLFAVLNSVFFLQSGRNITRVKQGNKISLAQYTDPMFFGAGVVVEHCS